MAKQYARPFGYIPQAKERTKFDSKVRFAEETLKTISIFHNARTDRACLPFFSFLVALVS